MKSPCRIGHGGPSRLFGIAMASMRTAVLAFSPVVLSVLGDDVHQHHMASPATTAAPTTVSGLRIPDVALIDQHGNTVHFYTDLVAGKVVAINTIFTTCTTICPLMGTNFGKLKKLLDDEVGRRALLISISIDPVVDTPQRLQEWSSRFGRAGPGWTLLTGSKADIDTLLKALQVFTADKQDHAPVVLIGGEGTGDWARASALLPPSQLAQLIDTRVQLMSSHVQQKR
jgi:protein SCO1